MSGQKNGDVEKSQFHRGVHTRYKIDNVFDRQNHVFSQSYRPQFTRYLHESFCKSWIHRSILDYFQEKILKYLLLFFSKGSRQVYRSILNKLCTKPGNQLVGLINLQTTIFKISTRIFLQRLDTNLDFGYVSGKCSEVPPSIFFEELKIGYEN